MRAACRRREGGSRGLLRDENARAEKGNYFVFFVPLYGGVQNALPCDQGRKGSWQGWPAEKAEHP
ncbi:MAG: hypothetical protein DMG26_06495 [Acidobacteria bacterium]|nr:MAG: hypothetical protein DMG26_06495 [Acidobacteriota bacterium]